MGDGSLHTPWNRGHVIPPDFFRLCHRIKVIAYSSGHGVEALDPGSNRKYFYFPSHLQRDSKVTV